MLFLMYTPILLSASPIRFFGNGFANPVPDGIGDFRADSLFTWPILVCAKIKGFAKLHRNGFVFEGSANVFGCLFRWNRAFFV